MQVPASVKSFGEKSRLLRYLHSACSFFSWSNAALEAELRQMRAEVTTLTQDASLADSHAAEQRRLQGDVCGAVVRALKAESAGM